MQNTICKDEIEVASTDECIGDCYWRHIVAIAVRGGLHIGAGADSKEGHFIALCVSIEVLNVS